MTRMRTLFSWDDRNRVMESLSHHLTTSVDPKYQKSIDKCLEILTANNSGATIRVPRVPRREWNRNAERDERNPPSRSKDRNGNGAHEDNWRPPRPSTRSLNQENGGPPRQANTFGLQSRGYRPNQREAGAGTFRSDWTSNSRGSTYTPRAARDPSNSSDNLSSERRPYPSERYDTMYADREGRDTRTGSRNYTRDYGYSSRTFHSNSNSRQGNGRQGLSPGSERDSWRRPVNSNSAWNSAADRRPRDT